MTYLKNFSLTVLTFFLVYTEVVINTFLSGNEYLEALPFFVYLFYVATFKFSRNSIIVLILNGFYYDLLFTDNYLGYTSIKFLLICMIVNFIFTKGDLGFIANFFLFYTCTLLYKFEIIFVNIDATLFYLLVICFPNYLLFKAFTSNLRRDVFSTKI